MGVLKNVIAMVRAGLQYQSFEDYYSALVARAPEVAPSVEEAWQDYLPRVEALATLHAVLL